MLSLTTSCVASGVRVARAVCASSCLQSTRSIVGGADHNKSEPTNSPWVKVLERPGAEHGNLSEEVYVENPYKNKDSKDVSADVPEKNPETQPQAAINPEVLAAADANKHSDSVRMMAGKLNQAVGGDADFPKTGGASIREMASEIGSNIKDSMGMHPADETKGAVADAAQGVADTTTEVVEKAREAVGAGKDNSS